MNLMILAYFQDGLLTRIGYLDSYIDIVFEILLWLCFPFVYIFFAVTLHKALQSLSIQETFIFIILSVLANLYEWI